MKTLSFALLLFIGASMARGQGPTGEQKIYYTVKVWGFVKYFHSRVSTRQVEWDTVFLKTVPAIMGAATDDEFNDALDTLLAAAGPMEVATTTSPDTLPPDLTRNRNFSWMNDRIFRDALRQKLEFIRDNFRPHIGCWVREREHFPDGFLKFPLDDPGADIDASVTYPDEAVRVLLLAKFWNINEYFNPNKYLIDVPWDSVLVRHGPAFVAAADYMALYTVLKRMTASLNDAHVELLTSSANIPALDYAPKLIVGQFSDGYRIVKSGYPELAVGDKLVSLNGRSMERWEDSLRVLISSGNPAVFRRDLLDAVIPGARGTALNLGFLDSTGAPRNLSVSRYTRTDNTWITGHYPSDSLSTATWRKWGCNVGYVHMGNLVVQDVPDMYEALRETNAIIFDVRNYPKGTVGDIAELMYPMELPFCTFTVPDIEYPGTCRYETSFAGSNAVQHPYRGTVIILCNEETQSHAEYTCMALRAMPKSVVVGSQTAGADGDVSWFKLTNDIGTGFTSLGVYYPDGRQTQRIGIVPDSVVIPTAEGLRAGRDEVLEKALQIAGCDGVSEVDAYREPARVAEPIQITAFPNPFRASTTIAMSRQLSPSATLTIHDLFGRTIVDLTSDIRQRGFVNIHQRQLPSSGLYLCRVSDGAGSQSHIICLLK